MKTRCASCSRRSLQARALKESSLLTHRFFMESSYTGGAGLREIAPPPWTDALPAEFRYPYDVLEQALPAVSAQGLRFYLTKEAYFLPEYGRDVVAVLLQEERCKTPVYGRHVRAVLRNLHSTPFLGYRPRAALTGGFTRLEAVLTFEFLRDCYTSRRSRYALKHPPEALPAPVRATPLVIHLPLGYHSQQELPQVPMAERSLDTFFVGQVSEVIPPGSYRRYLSSSKIQARKQIWGVLQELKKEGRWNMDLGDRAADQNAAAGQTTAGQTVGGAAFSSYSEKMMQSRICVAPRGSMADTFRSFEGLRAGCLVVANPLPKDRFLYPKAPLLIVDHWREVRGILERYARSVDALEDWRARSLGWWDEYLRPEVVGASVAVQLNDAGTSLLA
jgi:hypothetical protein